MLSRPLIWGKIKTLNPKLIGQELFPAVPPKLSEDANPQTALPVLHTVFVVTGEIPVRVYLP
jgi:hypothetical protein